MSVEEPSVGPNETGAVGSSMGNLGLEHAIAHAYELASKRHGAGVFRIKDIYVIGTNPLSEYRVDLTTEER